MGGGPKGTEEAQGAPRLPPSIYYMPPRLGRRRPPVSAQERQSHKNELCRTKALM
jgi:hypothetical protein